MNKRKIVTLAVTLCMIAILAVGGTLAYFVDSDKETNVFTVGKVDIDLIEDFPFNYDSNKDGVYDTHRLFPGVDAKKEVTVKNLTGSENAFVRVHIAVPAILDSGNEDKPEFAAYNNTLHWNFTRASFADGLWNWNEDKDGANYPGNGGAWNFYQQEVDGVLYNVYVATYETVLAAEETTAEPAITKVYLDTKIDNDISSIVEELKGDIKVLVVAEGAQEEGFTNAYDALDTAFGKPGTYNPWAA